MLTDKSARGVALRWSLLLLLGAAGGCAPSAKEVAAAHFGPKPDRCERVIEQEMDLTVFSGEHGDYFFKEPYKAAVNRKFLAKQEFGWVVEFEAKGPIAMGTGGYRTYHCFFPTDGTMAILTNDAIIHPIDEK